MKETKASGTSNSPWGKKLPKGTPTITFDFTYDAYENDAEYEADTKNHLSIAEQRKVRDNEALNAARNKAQQDAWEKAGFEKPDPKTDKQLQLKAVYKALMLSGMFTADQARQMASDNLGGIAWEDNE